VASWGVWASCRVMPGAFAEQMNIWGRKWKPFGFG
jgi:hypothetical protein